MGTVLGARPIGRELDTWKSKDKANQLMFYKGTHDKTTVMDSGDQHVSGNYICFTAGPYSALQGFNGGHIFGSFEYFYDGSMHNQRGLRNVFCILSERPHYQALRAR